MPSTSEPSLATVLRHAAFYGWHQPSLHHEHSDDGTARAHNLDFAAVTLAKGFWRAVIVMSQDYTNAHNHNPGDPAHWDLANHVEQVVIIDPDERICTVGWTDQGIKHALKAAS